jgi:hypothetical protein
MGRFILYIIVIAVLALLVLGGIGSLVGVVTNPSEFKKDYNQAAETYQDTTNQVQSNPVYKFLTTPFDEQ